MVEINHRIDDLIAKSIQEKLTVDEGKELDAWINKSTENKQLFENITSEDNLIKGLTDFYAASKMAEKVIERGLARQFKETPVSKRRSRLVPLSIAASLVIISILFHFRLNQPVPSNNIVSNNTTKGQSNKDVQSGVEKATLTLADGTKIVLDSVHNGQIAQQGNTTIINKSRQLVYNAMPLAYNARMQYNTLSTAKGETYQVILPDGSKVWLNAISSIHYPVAFTGKDRRVTVTGEAYFEVAKKRKMPFIATINNIEVQVLGTHFNIMGYDDEQAIKTTLLEGRVQVSSTANGQSSMLKPGEQAVAAHNSTLIIDHSPDIEQVIAWKNGVFDFNNVDLKTAMRQIARWYDLEVDYPPVIPNSTFWGSIHRDTKPANVLAILQKSSPLKFHLEGRKIIIRP